MVTKTKKKTIKKNFTGEIPIKNLNTEDKLSKRLPTKEGRSNNSRGLIKLAADILN